MDKHTERKVQNRINRLLKRKDLKIGDHYRDEEFTIEYSSHESELFALNWTFKVHVRNEKKDYSVKLVTDKVGERRTWFFDDWRKTIQWM